MQDYSHLSVTERVDLHAQGLVHFSDIYEMRLPPDTTLKQAARSIEATGGTLVVYQQRRFAVMGNREQREARRLASFEIISKALTEAKKKDNHNGDV